MRVAIITNNTECEKHVQYYATLERYLRENGLQVQGDFDADRLLICGCGFHDFMLGKVEQVVEQAQERGFSGDQLALLGCLPATHRERLEGSFPGRIIPLGQEQELDQWLGARVPFADILPTHVHGPEGRSREESSYLIKISQGCMQRCTFCVINRAKGPLRSEPLEAVLSQFEEAVSLGYRRIFLMGDDTFAYGLDRGSSIVELLDALLASCAHVNLHLGCLHVWWLERYADDLVRFCEAGVLRELQVGLQHVNEALLRRMGRPVDVAAALAVLERMRRASPGLRLMADILVGFPGETEEAFEELVTFLEQDRLFTWISHFGYSDVEMAPAHQLDGKVDPLQAAMRWERLRQVLGPRSLYNDPEEPEGEEERRYREAYRATLDSPFAFCVHTYRDP